MADHAPQVPDPSYDDKDIKIAPIVLSIVAVLGVTVLSMIGLRIMFRAYDANMFQAKAEESPFVHEHERPTEAVLQVWEAGDLAVHIANEDAILNQAPIWIDEDKGLAAVPLADAMRAVAAEGLPFRASEE